MKERWESKRRRASKSSSVRPMTLNGAPTSRIGPSIERLLLFTAEQAEKGALKDNTLFSLLLAYSYSGCCNLDWLCGVCVVWQKQCDHCMQKDVNRDYPKMFYHDCALKLSGHAYCRSYKCNSIKRLGAPNKIFVAFPNETKLGRIYYGNGWNVYFYLLWCRRRRHYFQILYFYCVQYGF